MLLSEKYSNGGILIKTGTIFEKLSFYDDPLGFWHHILLFLVFNQLNFSFHSEIHLLIITNQDHIFLKSLQIQQNFILTSIYIYYYYFVPVY